MLNSKMIMILMALAGLVSNVYGAQGSCDVYRRNATEFVEGIRKAQDKDKTRCGEGMKRAFAGSGSRYASSKTCIKDVRTYCTPSVLGLVKMELGERAIGGETIDFSGLKKAQELFEQYKEETAWREKMRERTLRDAEAWRTACQAEQAETNRRWRIEKWESIKGIKR
jgi:hypothetical protein